MLGGGEAPAADQGPSVNRDTPLMLPIVRSNASYRLTLAGAGQVCQSQNSRSKGRSTDFRSRAGRLLGPSQAYTAPFTSACCGTHVALPYGANRWVTIDTEPLAGRVPMGRHGNATHVRLITAKRLDAGKQAVQSVD